MQLIDLGEWKGRKIRARHDHVDYVSSTDMAQAEGKRWHNYWQTEAAKDYADAVAAETGIPVSGLIISERGGNERGGTWVHKLIAVHFAQWLSPAFAVWVSRRIMELLETGRTSIVDPDPMATFLREHAKLVEQNGRLVDQNGRISEHIESLVDEFRTSSEMVTEAVHAYYAYLRELDRRRPEQIEREVIRQVAKDEVGQKEVALKMWRIDVVTREHIIEVKYWRQWKHAVGQINTVSRYFDQEKRVHLFWKPFETRPTERQRQKIEKELRYHGIMCSWHDWKEPKGEWQRRLPLGG